MTNLQLPALITLLTVILMFVTAMNVGRARGKYKIAAPATSGDPMFDRAFRVQMNTLEYGVMFLPSLWLFAFYVSTTWASVLGAAWLVGRVWYAVGYMQDPKKRGPGYGISFFALIILTIGALIGLVMHLF